MLSGIDSLDLTCKQPAPRPLLEDLARLKVEAGENTRRAVTLSIGDDVLRVAATGLGPWWPYRLDHQFGQLGVGESANRPAWRVSLSAEALHVEGAARVVEFWRSVIEALTGGPVVLMASRLDVHADFAGLGIGESDRSAFVCRSGRRSMEFESGALETLYFGKGGDVSVRIYDKLAEVKASGKGGYLLAAYGGAGLRTGEPVQRVEAQLRREPLRSLGVVTAEDAISRAGVVYLYAVSKWLRLVVPGSATRRERAATDERWAAVQAADITQGVGDPKPVEWERHAPGLDVIAANVYGWLVRAGEALGVNDEDTAWRRLRLLVEAYAEDKGREFGPEVRARRLDLGSSVA